MHDYESILASLGFELKTNIRAFAMGMVDVVIEATARLLGDRSLTQIDKIKYSMDMEVLAIEATATLLSGRSKLLMHRR